MMDGHVVKEKFETVTHRNAEAARMQARADLRAHLLKFINRADSSDLGILCKDGVKVETYRLLLIGRSPVLDSMLTNGMVETNSSVISLPEIPAPALLAILEFLYTGDIVDYRPRGWRMGLEIISAAHFLLLPTVDKIVEEFIVAEIPNVYDDFVGNECEKAATMLSDAMTFTCLSHDVDVVLLRLVSLLESKWRQFCLRHLSEAALDFILRHTKPKLKTEDRLEDTSLEEYFRFRGVLEWCMYKSRSAPEEVNKLLPAALPLARHCLYSNKGVKNLSSGEVVWLPDYSGDRAQDEILQILKSQGALDSAIRLLAHIDWERVPPTIFVKIVERMKLVPESRLLDVFRFHSLHRVMPLKLSWIHKKSYSVHNGGLVIRNDGSSRGSAICQLGNRDDSCIWRFIVQNVHSSFCQLGFVCSEGLLDWNCEGDIVGSRTAVFRVVQWKAGAETVYVNGNGSGYVSNQNAYRIYPKSTEEIEFRYLRSARSCDVTVGDKKLGTGWAGLPGTNVYPAVSLGESPRAWVRLEIVSGFEIF